MYKKCQYETWRRWFPTRAIGSCPWRQRRVTACSKGILDPSVLQNNFKYTIKKNFYDPLKLFRPNSASEDLIVTYDYASLGCPLVAHYAALWLPELQVWYNNSYYEAIKVNFVMFEVNGIYDYSYELHLSDIDCVSEAQNWTSMLNKQAHPDPHTAWNFKNYRSCRKAGPPPTAPKTSEYQIMGGWYRNRILFPKRNGFYIFKAIVINSTYSFCELSTTFGVFIYGAYPEIIYSSELLLGAFILVFIALIFIGFALR
ncbi:hypothetical protein scyTo_0006272 [Scyliorhinus torazame]|uniref:CATSPERD/E C-terminal domain-containing protein n=1 Tax=Scyliorhinus torazame TaxID=75743 RepID=A0A401PGW8_SCYTO|nr:hypothetical protein [Scyliorhinus torazame]